VSLTAERCNVGSSRHPATRVASILLLALSAATVRAEKLFGRVVAIAEGDTLTVLDAQKTSRRVRLSGVDAPEMGQPYGHASKQNLSALVFNKFVAVENTKTDRSGRLVGKVLLDGLDVNQIQVLDGLAWHFK
jgi:endonuclease YncB( thermonuclease family)